MSNRQFVLEYIVKLTGADAAASQINGISKATQQNTVQTQKAVGAQEDYNKSLQKGGQNISKHSRDMKALAFGTIGLTSALVEAVGMWGMWTDTEARVAESQKELNDLIKEGKEGTKEYTDAVNEVEKAERFANMTRRNMILSMFDMVPFTLLTVNALTKLRGEGGLVGNMFSRLSGIFNVFRGTAITPVQVAVQQLGTTFTTFNTGLNPTITGVNTLSTTMTRASGTVAGVSPVVATLGTNMQKAAVGFRVAATSATPLAASVGAIGVTSVTAAGGVGVLSRALMFLKTNIRGVMLATGIGAAVVAITTLAELFLNASEASQQASNDIGGSAKDIASHVSLVTEAAEAGAAGVTSASGKMAKDFSADALKMADDIDALAKKLEELPTKATVAFLKAQKAQLGMAEGMPALLQKEADVQAGKRQRIGRAPGPVITLTPDEKAKLKAYHDGIIAIDKQIAGLIVTETKAEETATNLFSSSELVAQRFGLTINSVVEATKSIQPVMLETMDIMKSLLTQGMDPKLVKDFATEAFEKMFTGDELKMALHFLDVYFAAFDDFISESEKGSKETEKFTANMSEQAKTLLDTSKQYEGLVTELGGVIDVQDLNLRQLEVMKQLYADNIQVHIDQMLALKDESAFWVLLKEEQFQATIAAQEFTFANIDVTESLENSRKTILARNAAMIEGKLALQDFVTTTEMGIVKDREYESGLRNLIAAHKEVNLPLALTVEQMQELWKEMRNGGTGAITLANAFDEMISPLERFADIAEQLATGDKKGFKDKLKELFISKDLRRELKETEKDIANVQKLSFKINDTFQTLSLIELHGTSKNFDSEIDNIINSLSKLGKFDPDLSKFADFMKPFLESLKDLPDDQRQKALLALSKVWEELFGPDGTFTDKDATTSDVAAGIDKVRKALEGFSNIDLSGVDLGPLGFMLGTGEPPQTLNKFFGSKVLEGGKIVLTPEEQFKKDTTTLATNTGNLVTSTNNLKTSIDTLSSNLSNGSGLTNISTTTSDGEVQADPFGMQMAQMIIKASETRQQIIQIFLEMSGQLSNVWLGMATNFSFFMNSLKINAESARSQVIAAFLVMSGEASNVFLGLATNWSAMMNSMGPNAKSGASQVLSVMKNMASQLSSMFKKIASDFSAAMNKMKSAASSAASSIISSLKKIESQAKATAAAMSKAGMARGGLMSFAEGGTLSAASGRMFTTNGERQITIGDNPGGRETVAFIPHNNPGPTLEKIERMFGRFGGTGIGSGSTGGGMGGQGGATIVQVFLDGKQIKGEVVSMLARNQSAMK